MTPLGISYKNKKGKEKKTRIQYWCIDMGKINENGTTNHMINISVVLLFIYFLSEYWSSLKDKSQVLKWPLHSQRS